MPKVIVSSRSFTRVCVHAPQLVIGDEGGQHVHNHPGRKQGSIVGHIVRRRHFDDLHADESLLCHEPKQAKDLARQEASHAHNLQETPNFNKSIERQTLKQK
jgi:hypothetical protein